MRVQAHVPVPGPVSTAYQCRNPIFVPMITLARKKERVREAIDLSLKKRRLEKYPPLRSQEKRRVHRCARPKWRLADIDDVDDVVDMCL